MRQDVPAGRRTEVDAIGGYVLERAREHGLEVPVNETMTRLLRAWEATEGSADGRQNGPPGERGWKPAAAEGFLSQLSVPILWTSSPPLSSSPRSLSSTES